GIRRAHTINDRPQQHLVREGKSFRAHHFPPALHPFRVETGRGQRHRWPGRPDGLGRASAAADTVTAIDLAESWNAQFGNARDVSPQTRKAAFNGPAPLSEIRP